MSHHCEDCKHWFDDEFDPKGVWGYCKKRAPIIDGDNKCAFPETPALETCGDFSPSNGALN